MEFIILLPMYNEEKQIPVTVQTLLTQESLKNRDYGLLLVDDGSSDNSWNVMTEQSTLYPDRVRALRLSRNFGKEAAICAGLDIADADAVILMDGDLQHPPSSIPEMLRLWKEGYDIVEGVKSSRGDESFLSRMNAKFFYGLFRRTSGYDLENASDYKLLDRQVVLHWRTLKEHSTFFRGLSQWLGFQRATFSFEVAPRQHGKSRFSVRALFRLSFNAITSFSAAPLHLITFIGVLFFIGAVALAIQTLIHFFQGTAANGFTTVILMLLIIGSCLMISLGLIGTYIARIFEEVKNRPRYIVSVDTDKLRESGSHRSGDTTRSPGETL